MPYASKDRQRKAQRESIARRRQRAREAAARAGSTGGDVEPAAPARLPPSPSDLYRLGQWLNAPQMPHEPYSAYLSRLQARWRELRSLLETDS
jgi:hypothetical protein